MAQGQDSNDLEWALLTRYLTGDLSPTEAVAVERWFEADTRHRALLDELRDVWLATGGETAGWNTERTIVELRRRALRPERRSLLAPGGTAGGRAPSFAFTRRRPWMAVAAGLAACVLGGGAVLLHLMPRADRSTTAFGVPARATDVATHRAQRADVRLADGSRVILGPASRLSYTAEFGRRDRTVLLEGDAYFDVVHDDARPFRVRTARGVAEDLGTAFVVRARAMRLRVVVAAGAVVLRPMPVGSTRDSVVLTAGQLGRVLDDGRLDRVSTVSPEAYLAWTRGQLVFEDAPLAEVADELTRWYDVDVRVVDSADAVRRFSGRLEHRSVEDALRLVARVADVSVQRTGHGWVFHGRRSS